MFVRSITIYLVHKGTLDEYLFLEHGALAGIMCWACASYFRSRHRPGRCRIDHLIGYFFYLLP